MPSKSISRSYSRSSSSKTEESSSTVMWVIIGLLVLAILLIVFMSNSKYFEKFTNPTTPELQYFYMTTCHHCKTFSDTTWKALEDDVKKDPNVYKFKLVKYDINDGGTGKELANKYNINSAPTIVLVNGSDRHEYNGDRSKTDILNFVAKYVN
jgi:thiol-disulfide isomerase/thioredoxin